MLQPVKTHMSAMMIISSIIVIAPRYDIATRLVQTQHPRAQRVRSINPLYYLHHQVGSRSHQCNRQCSHITEPPHSSQ